jgi:hypothetical protein
VWEKSLVSDGPKGHPKNLPQPAWRLAELFFWSDMSWSRADLCANSYVISMRFSLLSKLPSCTHYISHVGIECIIHNLLFRIIHNSLFVELGPTGFPMMAFFSDILHPMIVKSLPTSAMMFVASCLSFSSTRLNP